MKKLSVKTLFVSFAIAAASLAQAANTIIPAPVSMTEKSGAYLINNPQVIANGFDKTPLNLINFTNEILRSGKEMFAMPNPSDKGVILQLDKTMSTPEEGYKLSVTPNQIIVSAKTEKGIFYGLQSLAQLINQKRIPCIEIEDYPRYKYRGLHLDVCRHMFSVSFIKKYIDLLAQYKMNSFHWHLTEDQGWRIEIKKYPELTSIGGYRDQTLVDHHRFSPQRYDNARYGGYYTQEEVKEVVAYATSKYIDVIPEIEMPGHALAALSAYPQLACTAGPFKASGNWGVFDDVFCAGKEETFIFLQNVLDEILPLFPSKYIHIGGDECPKTKWKTCELCQNRIKKMKLKDEHELQSYFVQRIEKYLNKKGRTIIGWDEILEGGIAPNATIMSWRGTQGGITAAKQHHDVIMTPSTHLYFDHAESINAEEPLHIGVYRNRSIPLKKVYDFNPTPDELSDVEKKFIIGVQANMWVEYIKTADKVLYMLLPRLYALSEIAWTPLENKNWKNFSETRVPEHLSKLDRNGITYRVPEPLGAVNDTIECAKYILDLKAPVKGAKIYYTTDGYAPNTYETQYKHPITIDIPKGEYRVLKCVTVTPSGRRSVVTTTLLNNK